jgi:hypothetical protein
LIRISYTGSTKDAEQVRHCTRKLDRLGTLIEVKAIGLDLKEAHMKQTLDYAANLGVDWVQLTNGIRWCVYHVFFTRPIQTELVVDINFAAISHKTDSDLETLYLWCRECWQPSALGEFRTPKLALSRFLGAMIPSDTILNVVRRELRRISPDTEIDVEQIRSVLTEEVLKRGAWKARRLMKIAKSAGKALRSFECEGSKVKWPRIGGRKPARGLRGG